VNTRHDPLGCDFPLPFTRTWYPVGVPVHLATNSEDVLAVADRLWSRYPATTVAPAVTFRVVVDTSVVDTSVVDTSVVDTSVVDSHTVDDRDTIDAVRPPTPRAQGHLLSIVHGPNNFAVCDLSASFAFARLTQNVARDGIYVRYHFLEAAVYTMIEARHFCPVHASCVALNGRAVLLCGDSGAGKTSLAYACARKGWTYLADDATCIVRNRPEPIVAGRPFSIRFRAAARALFPELRIYNPARRPNGKLDLEIDTEELGLTVGLESKADTIVFLNRKNNPAEARITPFSRPDALLWFSRVICYGDQHTRDAQAQALSNFMQLPVVELTYSDFDGAERSLRELVAKGNS
jgi:hypothetical protein